VKVDLSKKYIPSPDIVVRHIEGETIIIPITAGIGDLEDALFTLNPTGLAVWKKLDGQNSVADIIEALLKEYPASPGQIERDVLGLLEELYQKKLIVEVD